jgi:trans-2,3-dihydro-3-hydroxyanthranilate isomerase
MTDYRYLHLDVFTDRAFEGNQLAVFPEGAGLESATMQAIAREMAYSESTFVLERERPDTDVRMRIFTPGEELPMAGHPTIGSTFALAALGVIPARSERFVFGLGVGPTPVDLDWDGARLRFAWMTQLRPDFGPSVEDGPAIARMLHLDARDIGATPPQIVSCGVPFFYVPVTTRAAIDRAVSDATASREFWEHSGLT